MFTIVMGVDRDVGRALSCARVVAELPGGHEDKTVTVLHSFTDHDGGASAVSVESVSGVGDYLARLGIDHDIVAASGDPATAIVDAADELDADIILLAGRRLSPAGKVLFGSVTQSVMLATSRPVVVAGPGEPS